MPGRSVASELCALEVADLTEVPDGLDPDRRSKGDQEGQGQEVAIPRGYKLRPVEAVQTWLAAAEISAGPVFRAVTRGGRVSVDALADNSAARVVKRYARVGLDPASYAGHSLRSGFLTGGEDRGVHLEAQRSEPCTRASTPCAAMFGGSICSRSTLEQRSSDGGICTPSIPIMHDGA